MSIIYDDAPLEDRIHRALSDTFKHRAIETAQDVITGKRDALVAEVDNWEISARMPQPFATMCSRTLTTTFANLRQMLKKTVHRCILPLPTMTRSIAFWISLKQKVLKAA